MFMNRYTLFLLSSMALAWSVVAQVTTVTLSFRNSTELAAFTVSTYQTNLQAIVLDSTTTRYGSSWWKYHPGSTETVNNFNCVASTGVAGRWIKQTISDTEIHLSTGYTNGIVFRGGNPVAFGPDSRIINYSVGGRAWPAIVDADGNIAAFPGTLNDGHLLNLTNMAANASTVRSRIGLLSVESWEPVSVPTGFIWPATGPTFNVYRDTLSSNYVTDLSAGDYRTNAATKHYWLDWRNGNDTYDGTQPKWRSTTVGPMKSWTNLMFAMNSGGGWGTRSNVQIHVTPGVYRWADMAFFPNFAATNWVELVCEGDGYITLTSRGFPGREAAIDEGDTNASGVNYGRAYVFTNHYPSGVVDFKTTDSFGAPTLLSLAATLDACRTTAGTYVPLLTYDVNVTNVASVIAWSGATEYAGGEWSYTNNVFYYAVAPSTNMPPPTTLGEYWTNVTKSVVFRLTDSRRPDEDVCTYLSDAQTYSQPIIIRKGGYFEKMRVVGQTVIPGTTASATDQIAVFKDCSVVVTTNSLQGFYMLNDTWTYILEGCSSYYTDGDGFSFRNASAWVNACGVLINCKAAYNGSATAGMNNFTAHGKYKAVLLGCEGYYSGSRNFHAVDADTQWWLLGCTTGGAVDGSTGFGFYNTADCAMWLDGCNTLRYTMPTDISGVTAILYRNMSTNNMVLGGTLTSY